MVATLRLVVEAPTMDKIAPTATPPPMAKAPTTDEGALAATPPPVAEASTVSVS